MKIAVIEAPATLIAGSKEWDELCAEVQTTAPDLLLLNELPFGSWLSARSEPDDKAFEESVALHDQAMARLGDFGASYVLGSRACYQGTAPVNQGFIWTSELGEQAIHTKQFFPNEPGYYEARWFERGETHFRLGQVDELRVGFLICTEVMFNEWARFYGRNGADIIVCPRATELKTEKWSTALGMAAIASGSYVLSSNRYGEDEFGLGFGGKGMIFDPKGTLVAQTAAERRVVTHVLDRELIARMKADHPCNVEEFEGFFDRFKGSA